MPESRWKDLWFLLRLELLICWPIALAGVVLMGEGWVLGREIVVPAEQAETWRLIVGLVGIGMTGIAAIVNLLVASASFRKGAYGAGLSYLLLIGLAAGAHFAPREWTMVALGGLTALVLALWRIVAWRKRRASRSQDKNLKDRSA
jgi:hypothetical protein